ncbi:SHOCT domain-containing protein [Nitratidesulfovibrio sp. SRB-5]|uniref:SHOCT domain-containing protein n=1 Tax=Nitratidesulfovibrio vulgaris (strain DSM 19637 / Miyazaki F) TaxID=883 RepID=B8DL78_NITV9|nr:SHOCT domain-containing protein [Nitratidesulfovibrio sp. SRB-5]MBZ2172859.1 SHOCT domain-containing protein [Nitratidesulfovibrio sp. SRB-5]RXF76770.1 SHOCT domain-containing protein [Desulfovibrio sp. DS-1]
MSGYPHHFSGAFWHNLHVDSSLVVAGIALVALACLFVARSRRAADCRADRNDSMDILNRRLARGEITLEEYNTLKGAF